MMRYGYRRLQLGNGKERIQESGGREQHLGKE